ncbi:type II secretion system protein GspG [Haloferula sp. BvORR071]|uniref:type II secretion system protein GspG n=1 Tax=Haloferula sp. BvORR071 TaxID=1396141 RepID=UPI0005514944|nr:type II secretion system protein GspG [Haloferula sp. BvORR071]
MKQTSRRVIAATVASAAVAGGLYFLNYREIPQEVRVERAEGRRRTLPPAPAEMPAKITTLPVASEASAALGAADGTVEEDLSTIELLLSTYGRTHGGNPTGENEEIAAALLGKNPERLAYLEQGGSYLDRSGRLIDRWGTPYYFHSITASNTELRSAGPDGRIFTSDDVVHGDGETVK